MSMKLVDNNPAEEQVDLSKYVEVYYITTEFVGVTTKEKKDTFHASVECLDIPFIRDHESLRNYYESTEREPIPFYCTDLDSFDIDNDPMFIPKGKQFMMVLSYCDVATEVLQKDGSHCETDR